MRRASPLTNNQAMATSSSSAVSMEHQVFINFRGAELRNNFISHLETALKNDNITYYIDTMEVRSEAIEFLLERIKKSDIAIAVFSERYTESEWCLNELVKIMEEVKENKLRVIPIFFNVEVDHVKNLKGVFGSNFHNNHGNVRSDIVQAWKEALQYVPTKLGLTSANYRSESDLITVIVDNVKRVISVIDRDEGSNTLSRNISSPSSDGNASSRDIIQPKAAIPRYGMQQRLKELEEMFDFDCQETQIVGIVGMPGIGKTTLAELFYNSWNHKFVYNEFICEKSKDHEFVKNKILRAQLDRQDDEMVKGLIVIENVSDKNQLEFLWMNRERIIKEGSKIVITTRDKGLIEGLVQDVYVVPGLNDKQAMQLFTHHAFDGQDSARMGHFDEMSKFFVDYAGGNPRALEELGKELSGKNKVCWKSRLEALPHCSNENIGTELKIIYAELTEQQQRAFLDIACFFKREEEEYIRVLLDSYDSNSGEAAMEVSDLANKFLISISAGRIEMHNLMCTIGKEIGSSVENHMGKSRLWNHDDVLDALLHKKGTSSARGIFLDTSKLAKGFALERKALTTMRNLRYVKIFDSHCPRQCEIDCKVNLPEGLEFSLKEIRYLHWLKFPLEELPSDFKTDNIIDLRLPYSKIKRVWRGNKNTPKLKWVDLSHSTMLNDLAALKNAEFLRRLNLEGCTLLTALPEDMENMKNLAFLNLRGCTNLMSLPKMKNLTALKTLILSGCLKFQKFQSISENLEYLHLDGTAIEELPSTIQNLRRLIVLNMKNCKKLESLPDCLDKFKSLEELILSGCSALKTFPKVKEFMENLQILLLDGTSIKELPNGLLSSSANSIELQRKRPRMNGLSSLRRLCLSNNDMISCLHCSISELHHLKWIDLKYCENLTSLSTLPPNLQCLDAHSCISLKTVARPLAVFLPLAEKTPSSFIFTNCEKLEHVAKSEIICYAHNKSRLILDALSRQNKVPAFETLVSTCFPGSEIPAWFSHKASGAVLEHDLPRHWSESGFVGIALCAIVSFHDYKIQNNNLMVKCKCEFNNVFGTSSSSVFNCNVGSLSDAGDDCHTIKSTHVFIGFTSWLNIDKCQEVGPKKECIPTKASIKFVVTDGTCEAANCEILKCGFSLVCESDNGSSDDNSNATSVVCESENSSLDTDIGGANPMEEEVRDGGSRFLGLLRRRPWPFAS